MTWFSLQWEMVRRARDAETLEKNMVAKPWMYAHAKKCGRSFLWPARWVKEKICSFFSPGIVKMSFRDFLGCSSHPPCVICCQRRVKVKGVKTSPIFMTPGKKGLFSDYLKHFTDHDEDILHSPMILRRLPFLIAGPCPYNLWKGSQPDSVPRWFLTSSAVFEEDLLR